MRLMLFALAVLIAYGSLYPFGFRPERVSWSEFVAFATHIDVATSRGNLVANLLLFAPVGLFAVLANERNREQRVPLWVSVTGALLLAFGLQVAQLWIIGRHPAMSDAIINAAGLIIGIGVAWTLRRLAIKTTLDAMQHVIVVPCLLALLWVSYRWFPGVPSIDLQNIKDSIKPLLLQPWPDPTRILSNATGWLAWMIILLRARIRGLTPINLAMASLLIVGMQVLFVNNTISINNVLGLAIAVALLPALRHLHAPTAVWILLLTSMFASGLYPFTVAQNPNVFQWLPFAGYLGGSMESNALALIYKAYVYGALIYLMHLQGRSLLRSTLVAAFWLGIIEGLQIWFIGRTPEITDPLLALLIGHAMHQIHKHDERALISNLSANSDQSNCNGNPP